MPDQTPATELRTAADKLRQAAAAADETNAAPWTTVKPSSNPGSTRAFVFDANGDRIACGSSMGGRAGAPWIAEVTAAYIALMHPGVGLALADLFDDAAGDFEMCERQNSRDPHNEWKTRIMPHHMAGSALKLARQLLGEVTQ